MKIKIFSPHQINPLFVHLPPKKANLEKFLCSKFLKIVQSIRRAGQKSHTVKEFNFLCNKTLSVVVKPSLFVTFKSTPLPYFK